MRDGGNDSGGGGGGKIMTTHINISLYGYTGFSWRSIVDEMIFLFVWRCDTLCRLIGWTAKILSTSVGLRATFQRRKKICFDDFHHHQRPEWQTAAIYIINVFAVVAGGNVSQTIHITSGWMWFLSSHRKSLFPIQRIQIGVGHTLIFTLHFVDFQPQKPAKCYIDAKYCWN